MLVMKLIFVCVLAVTFELSLASKSKEALLKAHKAEKAQKFLAYKAAQNEAALKIGEQKAQLEKKMLSAKYAAHQAETEKIAAKVAEEHHQTEMAMKEKIAKKLVNHAEKAMKEKIAAKQLAQKHQEELKFHDLKIKTQREMNKAAQKHQDELILHEQKIKAQRDKAAQKHQDELILHEQKIKTQREMNKAENERKLLEIQLQSQNFKNKNLLNEVFIKKSEEKAMAARDRLYLQAQKGQADKKDFVSYIYYYYIVELGKVLNARELKVVSGQFEGYKHDLLSWLTHHEEITVGQLDIILNRAARNIAHKLDRKQPLDDETRMRHIKLAQEAEAKLIELGVHYEVDKSTFFKMIYYFFSFEMRYKLTSADLPLVREQYEHYKGKLHLAAALGKRLNRSEVQGMLNKVIGHLIQEIDTTKKHQRKELNPDTL